MALRIALAGAAILFTMSLLPKTGLADEMKRFLNSVFFPKRDVSELVQDQVYSDEDGHVQMQVSETLCDGAYFYMTVKYQALDGQGSAWLEKIFSEQTDVMSVLGLEESEAYIRHSGGFSVDAEIVQQKKNNCVISYCIGGPVDDYELLYRESSIDYPMTEGRKTAKLEIEKNLETVTYELTPQGTLSELFEPKYLRVSPLSFVIDGYDHGMIDWRYQREDDYSYQSCTDAGLQESERLLENGMQVCLFLADGTKVSDTEGWRLGGPTAEEMKRGDGVDFHVASAEVANQEVDPETIDHITIAGIRYDVKKIE